MRSKTILSWSSGKDSALALHELHNSPDYEVAALLTVVMEDADKIGMHQVPSALVEQQAASIGLPIRKVLITDDISADDYAARMHNALSEFAAQGVSHVAFGDLYLQDLRQYREDKLAQAGLSGLFPIWERDTASVARRVVDLGFKAIVTCVDTTVLDASFLGRTIDEQFLADLPEAVDPCGEKGEFHSFVYDGPIFRSPIAFEMQSPTSPDGRFLHSSPIPCE